MKNSELSALTESALNSIRIIDNRLGSLNNCWLCNAPNNGVITFEDHHIVPRHLGGTNGPLVFLCAHCHTNVHKTAEHWYTNKFVPIYKDVKKDVKLKYLAGVICKARQLVEKTEGKQTVISGRLDYETHSNLKALAKYLGMSQHNTMKYAINKLYNAMVKGQRG